jgi:energy-coupling factor transporter transmembrane protein EcfT
MSKQFRDSVSFAVMAVLMFVVVSLSCTLLTGSSGAGIRYLDLHWIVFRADLYQVFTIWCIYKGKLAAVVAISICLTWALSVVLKVLHCKKSRAAWLIFVFVVLLLLALVCEQDFIFT